MDAKKKKHLPDQGRSVDSTRDLPGLTDNENAYIELKIMPGENLKEVRLKNISPKLNLHKLFNPISLELQRRRQVIPLYRLFYKSNHCRPWAQDERTWQDSFQRMNNIFIFS